MGNYYKLICLILLFLLSYKNSFGKKSNEYYLRIKKKGVIEDIKKIKAYRIGLDEVYNKMFTKTKAEESYKRYQDAVKEYQDVNSLHEFITGPEETIRSGLNVIIMYEHFLQCLKLRIPNMELNDLLGCERDYRLVEDVKLRKKSDCYVYHTFKSLIGVFNHSEDYTKFKEKLDKDEYLRFLQRYHDEFEIDDISFDTLEELIIDINDLDREIIYKLFLYNQYIFRGIVSRFSYLHSLPMVGKGDKLFKKQKYIEMLNFICRDEVKKFWRKLVINIKAWEHFKTLHPEDDIKMKYFAHIDPEHDIERIRKYQELTEKWERMQRQKDSQKKDK